MPRHRYRNGTGRSHRDSRSASGDLTDAFRDGCVAFGAIAMECYGFLEGESQITISFDVHQIARGTRF